MIARVTLELSLRKEFDYFIPTELAAQIDVGSRVQVPFGARKVLGCVTALAEESKQNETQTDSKSAWCANPDYSGYLEIGALDRPVLLLLAGSSSQKACCLNRCGTNKPAGVRIFLCTHCLLPGFYKTVQAPG